MRQRMHRAPHAARGTALPCLPGSRSSEVSFVGDVPDEPAPGAHHALIGGSIIEPNGLLGHWRRPPLISSFSVPRDIDPKRGGAPGTPPGWQGRLWVELVHYPLSREMPEAGSRVDRAWGGRNALPATGRAGMQRRSGPSTFGPAVTVSQWIDSNVCFPRRTVSMTAYRSALRSLTLRSARPEMSRPRGSENQPAGSRRLPPALPPRRGGHGRALALEQHSHGGGIEVDAGNEIDDRRAGLDRRPSRRRRGSPRRRDRGRASGRMVDAAC